MPSRVVPIIIVVIAVALPAWARWNDADVERFKSDAEKRRLIGKAAAQWNTVNRWRIEYETTPSATSKGSVATHQIMAVAAPGELYHLGAHFSRDHPWQADPYCQEFFIHQGSTCQRWSFNRAFFSGRKMNSGDAVPGSIPEDALLPIVPRWPVSTYKMPVGISGARIIAAEALQSPDYLLLSDSEPVGGEDCAVLDRDGIDRIWIATSKGLCVMRRDIRDRRSGRVLRRIVTDKVDQVAPGFWLPTEYRTQILSVRQHTNEDMVQSEYKVQILSCVLNENVADSIFIPVHRPGSIRYDSENRFTQASAGGEDLLDDIVNFMTKHAGLPMKPIRRNYPFLWLVAGLATGVCTGLLLFPWSRRPFKRA